MLYLEQKWLLEGCLHLIWVHLQNLSSLAEVHSGN